MREIKFRAWIKEEKFMAGVHSLYLVTEQIVTKETFGVISVPNMHKEKHRLYELFDYIILTKNPQRSYWTKYDRTIRTLDANYYYTKRFIIIQLH